MAGAGSPDGVIVRCPVPGGPGDISPSKDEGFLGLSPQQIKEVKEGTHENTSHMSRSQYSKPTSLSQNKLKFHPDEFIKNEQAKI